MAIQGIGSINHGAFRSVRAERASETNLERLSSGSRLNKAADDAAGMAIAKQLLIEVGSVAEASRNVEYGVSQGEIADGALSAQSGIVGRMRELAMQAANGTLGESERGMIQTEYEQLRSEIDRIAQVTEFNGNALLQGGSTELQVGTGGDSDSRIAMNNPQSDVIGLGLDSVDLSTAEGAQAALQSIDEATETLSTSRADLGATRNRLESALAQNSTTTENLVAAASRITDTDIAAESTELALNNVREAMTTALSKQKGLTAGLLVDLVA